MVSGLCMHICSASSESATVTWLSANGSVFISWNWNCLQVYMKLEVLNLWCGLCVRDWNLNIVWINFLNLFIINKKGKIHWAVLCDWRPRRQKYAQCREWRFGIYILWVVLPGMLGFSMIRWAIDTEKSHSFWSIPKCQELLVFQQGTCTILEWERALIYSKLSIYNQPVTWLVCKNLFGFLVYSCMAGLQQIVGESCAQGS